MIITFDIDGTICSQSNPDYENAVPFQEKIDIVNTLFDRGYIINFFTSRYMGRTNSNIKKVYEIGYDFTFNQLQGWNIKFHNLFMGKPLYDIFIDDKCLDYKDNWENHLIQKIKV